MDNQQNYGIDEKDDGTGDAAENWELWDSVDDYATRESDQETLEYMAGNLGMEVCEDLLKCFAGGCFYSLRSCLTTVCDQRVKRPLTKHFLAELTIMVNWG